MSRNVVEDRIIHAIDTRDKWMEMLTEDEWVAGRIVFGIDKPDGKYTRKWALRTWKEVTESNLVSKASAHVLRTNNLNSCMDLFEYFVPKAKQVVETSGPGGGPQEHIIHGEFMDRLMTKIDGTTRGLLRPEELPPLEDEDELPV